MTQFQFDITDMPTPGVRNRRRRPSLADTSDLSGERARIEAYGPDYFIKRWEERSADQQIFINDYLRLFLVWLVQRGHLPDSWAPQSGHPSTTCSTRWVGVMRVRAKPWRRGLRGCLG